jgi:hypothetical protein
MEEHILKFRKGVQHVDVVRAVEEQDLTKPFGLNNQYKQSKCVKFVPASGAATRLWKHLFEFINTFETNEFVELFFSNIQQFPFYEELNNHIDLSKIDLDKIENRLMIANIILGKQMNLSSKPKALIPVHNYGDFLATPMDEHVFEGIHYLNEGKISIHFTISKNHEKMFNQYSERIKNKYPNLDITYSFQKDYTDTIAVDMDNNPLFDENNKPLHRPGGHGALLENLIDIDADIVFIKNIDNVCHKNFAYETIDTFKMLATTGYVVKKQIDTYIRDLNMNQYHLQEIFEFIKNVLKIEIKIEPTKEFALDLLKRPFRVCGVVRNEGEPGGGPFIVDNGDYLNLQIVEMSELDHTNVLTTRILEKASYFNPVMLVCFIKDEKNQKYDLRKYVNENRYFISHKSYKGKPIKALEHPGLWNGSMHYWNTLFVEVPSITFNPIKVISDLLRPGHKGKY